MPKKIEFTQGTEVKVHPQTANCPIKLGRLAARAKMTPEELTSSLMKVIHTDEDGQVAVHHPRKPFIAHAKFFAHAQA